ncbi:MAG: methyltransferase domain-containing protein [Verrucomicrobia bacterium]|nr:methyltransferase domain-containing protein [Verrucomicrobiota bacterium]
MGLNSNAILFLLGAHRSGVRFERCLTVGRLHINVYRQPLQRMLQRAGVYDEVLFNQLSYASAVTYADPVLRMLGARDLHVMDVSDYEGADTLQDLNQPIPESLKSRFDVVCDGGSLEHVFNVPTALRNYMDMVVPGGSLFIHTPANSCCGHGFYQFSPDLFYRALSPENGFKVVRLILHADGPYNRWYQVADPREVRQRVELITWKPMHMLVHAVKTRDVGAAWVMPQQTTYEAADYKVMRTELEQAQESRRVVARAWWADHFPRVTQLLRVLKHGFLFYATHSLFNRRLYQPVPKLPPT